jgi:hypothetical protein
MHPLNMGALHTYPHILLRERASNDLNLGSGWIDHEVVKIQSLKNLLPKSTDKNIVHVNIIINLCNARSMLCRDLSEWT